LPALKIGIELASLRLPFRKALVAAARLGASGVEIDARGELKPQALSQTGMRELRRLFEEVELRVVAVTFQTRRGYDVADEIDRRVAATKTAMRFAAELRAPVVVNQVGQVPGEDETERWQVLTGALADLGRFSQHVGVRLAARTGSESAADLARLLAALPEGSTGVDLDPAALVINGFSPLEAVALLGSNILHVHARDGVRDRARRTGLEVALGRGTADFPALLGALEEQQYRGYFTIARHDTADPQAEIAAAVEYLRSL